MASIAAAVVGKETAAEPQVIVHVRDDPLDVVLHGLDRRIGRREPELLVGVQPEVLGDLEDPVEFRRQALLLPAGDGLVPPHGPFPARQAIDAPGSSSGPGSVRRGSWFRHDVCPWRRTLCRLSVALVKATFKAGGSGSRPFCCLGCHCLGHIP